MKHPIRVSIKPAAAHPDGIDNHANVAQLVDVARPAWGRVSSYGIDQCAINVEVYAQAREMLLLFESLQNAAQAKRLLLLKEIKGHQAAIRKAKRLPT